MYVERDRRPGPRTAPPWCSSTAAEARGSTGWARPTGDPAGRPSSPAAAIASTPSTAPGTGAAPSGPARSARWASRSTPTGWPCCFARPTACTRPRICRRSGRATRRARRASDPAILQLLAELPLDARSTSPSAHALERQLGAELIDRLGPAVLFTHSAGAPAGWLIAAARPELVRAIVALEPFGPPFRPAADGLAGPAPRPHRRRRSAAWTTSRSCSSPPRRRCWATSTPRCATT